MTSRAQKRWAPRLRTGGALLLLGGAVATLDHLLPRSPDPVLGGERSAAVVGAIALMVAAGAIAAWLGRRWR